MESLKFYVWVKVDEYSMHVDENETPLMKKPRTKIKNKEPK